MSRTLRVAALVVTLCAAPRLGRAASVVFAGDPVDPSNGVPYEILPGFPLVLSGPDGVVGTPDDVINTATIGDIDMVVRSGSVAAADVIPPPTAASPRSAWPVGVAGSSGSGGVEIPFTVFLSDGATSLGAPFGHLLTASDMDGIPAIVAVFADFDGDGFIGPTNADASGSSDSSREVGELEPVGRAVAVFNGGVARGSVAIRSGGPASRGGLKVALTALALTGPFDASFFGGNIPSGPAISTALPFYPERDLSKLIRDRPVPALPNSTLQQVIRFASLPHADAVRPLALRLDGSSPTIDVAIVNAQPAVRVAFREYLEAGRLALLGTSGPASYVRCHLIPVDRWGNWADPPPGFTVSLHAAAPLQVLRPRHRGESVTLRSSSGVRVVARVAAGSSDGAEGVLSAEHSGVVVGSLRYQVSAGATRALADVVVPSIDAPTIQAAIANVTDRNHDGRLVVAVRAGIYRENVLVNRSVELRGDDAATTFVQGDGTSSVLSVTAPDVVIRGLTAIGGTSGFALSGPSTQLVASRAWRNQATGVSVASSAVLVWQSAAVENGADGFTFNGANAASCTDSAALDNGGGGVVVSNAQNAQIERNRVAGNATGGLTMTTTTDSTVTDNQSVDNFGPGIQIGGGEAGAGGVASGRPAGSPQNNQLTNNLSGGNDGDGLNMDSTNGNLVFGNALDLNKGYGLFLRRSTDDDFSATPGVQGPLGDNTAEDNRRGDFFIRTN